MSKINEASPGLIPARPVTASCWMRILIHLHIKPSQPEITNEYNDRV